MEKLMKKQSLTSAQYKRANRAMCLILALSYIVYIVVEIMNIGKFGMSTGLIARCVLYGIALVSSAIVYKLMGTRKFCMLYFAVAFLISFAILIFNNGVVVITLVFPALIGFMIYLNSMLVGIGCVGSIIICVIKCIILKNDGNTELFNYGLLITAGVIVATVGSLIAISLLIDFSKEDRAIIENEASHRAQVAEAVAGIVSNLDAEFREMLTNLSEIKLAMEKANIAIKDISGSSEGTASAASHQAGMTTNIQNSLENTNELATNATETTDDLKNVIVDGKSIADDLLEQSQVVDTNITKISKTIEELSDKVQKVSVITDTIVNISEQTNLLALNASIEAARAGEAGKGFAVVAEEIRKLAEETQDSTNEIIDIISELTEVTRTTQDEIMESTFSINEQRRKVDEVNDSFVNIEYGMNRLREDVINMSREVESVLNANTEIVDSISQLSAASEEVSAGTETCMETIDMAFENLEEFSKKVDGTFEQLKVLEETAGA